MSPQMLFSISLQVWIEVHDPETGLQGKKKEKKKLKEMLLNREGVCDTLQKAYVCGVLLYIDGW